MAISLLGLHTKDLVPYSQWAAAPGVPPFALQKGSEGSWLHLVTVLWDGVLILIWVLLISGKFYLEKSSLYNTLPIDCGLPYAIGTNQNQGLSGWHILVSHHASPSLLKLVMYMPWLSAHLYSDSSPVVTNDSVVQGPSASVSLWELVRMSSAPSDEWGPGAGVSHPCQRMSFNS